MAPQEEPDNDPIEMPTPAPDTAIIDDPDIPLDAPVDDVFDPQSEGPDVTD